MRARVRRDERDLGRDAVDVRGLVRRRPRSACTPPRTPRSAGTSARSRRRASRRPCHPSRRDVSSPNSLHQSDQDTRAARRGSRCRCHRRPSALKSSQRRAAAIERTTMEVRRHGIDDAAGGLQTTDVVARWPRLVELVEPDDRRDVDRQGPFDRLTAVARPARRYATSGRARGSAGPSHPDAVRSAPCRRGRPAAARAGPSGTSTSAPS